jgi:predicted dehydrogenase
MNSTARHNLTRRHFLRNTAASVAFPYIIMSSAMGADGQTAPSNRLNIGFIGVGGQGGGHLNNTHRDDMQTIAVCDVDATRMERARKRVNDIYAEKKTSGTYKGCDAYRDFRELLAREDIDAVLIASPDHWHALLSIAAMKSGKDVYCEKPHSHSIVEGRAVCETARRYGRVFQTGSQERSGGARLGCELVRNGYLGRIHTIRTWLPTRNHEGGPKGEAAQPIPPELDYDTWLGPAPWAPYHIKRCHANFRWNMDYSDGELTDRGAHVNDIAMWGNGTDRTGPIEIKATGEIPADGLYNTPIRFHIEYLFANGVRMICTSEDATTDGMASERGIKFEGSDGWLFIAIHGAAMTASNPDIVRTTIGPDEMHLHRSIGGHFSDWLNSIRTRTETVAPAEAGHRTSSLCHLGLIGILTGRKLAWDPDRECFPKDPHANSMLTRPMRSPWHL